MKKFLIIFFITILLIILAICGVVYYKYFSWRKSFEITKQHLVCTNNINTEELSVSVEEKIKKFVKSKDKTDYISFTIPEIAYFLKANVDGTGTLSFDTACIEAKDSKWRIYVNMEIADVNIPWASFYLIKDNMQTAQLYPLNIYIGNMQLPDSIAKTYTDQIARGINDALVTVLENDFTSRTIDNIELKETEVIIKGTKK